MAHFVFIPHPHTSTVVKSLALAEWLREAGHQITFIGDDFVTSYAEKNGVTAHRLPPKQPTPKENLSRIQRWLKREERLQEAVERLNMPAFETLLTDLQPDLVLSDIEMQEQTIASVGLGIQTCLISSLLFTLAHPSVPPLHDYAVVGEGWRGSCLGIALLWWRYRIIKWLRNTRMAFGTGGVSRISIGRHYAQQVGFDFRKHVSLYDWLIPYNITGLPLLYLRNYELEFPYDVPPNVYYLGAVLNTTRQIPNDNANDAIQDLLSQHRAGTNNRKLVYCSFGTFIDADDLTLWLRVIDAFSDAENVDLILGLGGRISIERLGTLPPHIIAADWVPQLEVLEVTDCAIVHTGSSTVAECLYYGVPMLSYPFDMYDQMGNVSRAVYHGVCIVGNREADDAATIRQHVDRLLTDSTIHENIKRLQAIYRDPTIPQRAVSIIENMLKS